MKIRTWNKTVSGGFGLKPGFLCLVVFYFATVLGVIYVLGGGGGNCLQAEDFARPVFLRSLTPAASGETSSPESNYAQGSFVNFYQRHPREIWIIGGVVLVLALLLVNIVHRRRMERKLCESEDRWKLLFKGFRDGSFIINEQHEIEDINDALCEMTDFSREELLGKLCTTICMSPIEQCLISSGELQCILEQKNAIKAKGGRIIPVLKSVQRIPLEGRIVILENFQDMTHHKKIEDSLQCSEEIEQIFRKRLASLRKMSTVLTCAESRDELCKQAVELARDELEFKRIEIWFISDKLDEIIGSYGIDENGSIRDERRRRRVIGEDHFIRKALETNIPGIFSEIGEISETAGIKGDKESRVISALWDGREIIGYIQADTMHTNRGISEVQQKILNIFAFSLGHMCARLTMGEQHSHLEAQLQQSAKMEAVGRLAGGIAHDFNNQLTVITGYCDLLLRDLASGSQTHESVEQISKSARQASVLTGELLNLSRKETFTPDVVDPNRMLWSMEKSLSMLGEEIKLEIHTADNLGNVRVDANRFQQVIMNLAINARDAMPEGGKLLIEATNYTFRSPLTTMMMPLKPGPYVRIIVTDTGVGMDKEIQEKVFEPFFTTKEKGKGTGLGLSQVYGFVKQSGGEINIESAPGRGTTFSIYLPRVGEPASDLTGRSSKSSIKKSNETVLVVEDDPAVRRLVVRVLREYGYDVMETGHPEDALRMVRGAAGPIDLLIADVVMPGLSGPKLAETLDTIQPGLKVLYISGYTEETVIKHGVKDLNISFLHKPFSPEELYHAIDQILSGKKEESILRL